MSSGIEVLIFAPFLIPGLLATGGSALSGATVGGAGLAVSGSSVVTTGAFASGGIATGGAGTLAAGAAALGGAVVVVGAAGAALLAVRHMKGEYDSALTAYNERLDVERSGLNKMSEASRGAEQEAIRKLRKSSVRAAESAEVTFLAAGAKRLQSRITDRPDIDPDLPGACAALSQDLSSPSPDLAALFKRYEYLNHRVSKWLASHPLASTATVASSNETLRTAQEDRLNVLREDVVGAPPELLASKIRNELEKGLSQVALLITNQPHIAEQSLDLLGSRIRRELSASADRLSAKRKEEESKSIRLRELAGIVSARAQATLAVLKNEDLTASTVARPEIEALQARAMQQLQRLSTVLADGSNANLTVLEKLATEADALFESTADELRQIALQIYLEEQVAEVFTQLGYRVSTLEDRTAGQAGMIAAIDAGRGVEVHVDGNGHFSSELVAFGPGSSEAQLHDQEKVCEVMDEVFAALRSRGCQIREKKRRHFKAGERALRVVSRAKREVTRAVQSQTPLQRRLDE